MAVPAWIARVIDGSVTGLRAEYTFALAHLCACPPPVADRLRLLDFARLIDAIDRHNAAQAADPGRLADVALVKTVELRILVAAGDAQARLDALAAKAKDMDGNAIKMRFRLDDGEGSAQLDAIRAKADRLGFKDVEVKVKVDGAGRAVAELTAVQHEADKVHLKTLGGGGPALLGPALLALPAIATLGGVAAGALIGLGGAAVAGGGALAAFGAVAKPVLTDAKTAAAAAEKAQNNYNIAIAHGANPAKAYKAEQIAIGKAYAELSPAQIALSKQLQGMGHAWQAVKAAQTPVVAGALQPWLRSVTDLTKQLGPVIARVSPVIKSLGGEFGALISSSAFKSFSSWVGKTGSSVIGTLGQAAVASIDGLITLLPKFTPLMTGAANAIGGLAAKFDIWTGSKKGADEIQGFLKWFSANGPVVSGLLKNIGGAMQTLLPGLAAGGMGELKAVSGLFGLIAKLPPGIAKPIAEVAGALLLLNKLGVLKVGIQFVGAAVKWLTGGAISIGGGATAAAEMRAAFATGGATAAAEIRAAMTGGGTTAAAEMRAAAGTGGAGRAAAFFGSAANVASLGIAIGIGLRTLGNTIAPKGSPAGKYSQALQQQSGRPGPAQQLHPYILGGFEGWAMAHLWDTSANPASRVAGRYTAQAANVMPKPAKIPPPDLTQFNNTLALAMSKTKMKPVKLPAPDLSQFNAAMAKAMAATGKAALKPVKVPAPDLSALTGAKGKAGADGSGIFDAVSRPLKKPAKMAAPDLSAAKGAAGTARGIGVSISSGLAAGIEAGKGTAVAAAADVASSVTAAMGHAVQARSPSKVTQKLGMNITAGLILGLQGGQAEVSAAAQLIAASVVKPFTSATIAGAVKKLEALVPSRMTGWLKEDNARLLALAGQRAALEKEIQASEQVAQSEISNASIMNAGAAGPSGEAPAGAQSLISGMQFQRDQIRQFAQQVAQLRKMGLNATSLSQIIGAGSGAGLGVAQGLTAGGKDAVSQVNALQAQIKGSAAKLGDVAAPAMYAAGVQAGQGLAAGLKSQLAAVVAAIRQLAKEMVAAAKGALKIHSPSEVFRELGQWSGRGLILGLGDSVPGVAGASRQLAHAAAGGWTPAMAGVPGRGGSGDIHLHFEAMVHTQDSVKQAVQAFREYKRHGGGTALGIA